jgi:hypothetical protein
LRTYVLEREQIIPRPRSEAFGFFTDVANLERITPPFLRFRILTPPPVEIREGTLIRYSLTLLGIRFEWETLITNWEPDHCFSDIQLSGPYKRWQHTHTFEEIGAHSTLMCDRVDYQLPFGLLGRVAHPVFVRRALRHIFDYRARSIEELLAAR